MKKNFALRIKRTPTSVLHANFFFASKNKLFINRKSVVLPFFRPFMFCHRQSLSYLCAGGNKNHQSIFVLLRILLNSYSFGNPVKTIGL